MTPKSPKITVIMATFNSAKTLARAIESFETQTYPHKELVIADGGSKDGTLEIIRKHAGSVAHWFSEPDTGIYNAWNKALNHVTGDWVYFLGSDDALAGPNVFEQLAPRLAQAHPPTRIVYGKVAITAPSGSIITYEGPEWDRNEYRHFMTIPHQGTFHHKSLFEVHGKFNEQFRICGDYELTLRELKDADALFIPELTVASMEFGGASSDLKNTPLVIRELKLARKLNGIRGVSLHLLGRDLRCHTRRALQAVLGPKFTHRLADFYRACVGKPRLWTRKDLERPGS